MLTRKWKMINAMILLAMLLALLAGCKDTSDDGAAVDLDNLEPVTLTWHLDGPAPTDIEKVQAAINDLPQVKALNATVEFVFYEWGAYDQKMQLMFAGGEECDLVFTASWANSYVNNAINGNIIELDEMLPKYAPKTWDIVSDVAWNMSKVEGKIYGIPNQQLWYQAWGLIVPTKVAEELDMDVDKLETYQELTPYMLKYLEMHPELEKKVIGEVGGESQSLTWGYEPVASAGVIKIGDMSRKVVNWYDTDEYREATELFRSWYEAGLSPDEPIESDALRQGRMENVGWFPFKFHVAKPGVGAEETAMTGQPQLGKSFQAPVLSYVTPTMTGICATSKNPERALMLFDLFYYDEEVYNTLAKGLEGVHWDWVDEANKVIDFPEGVTADTSGWNLNRDWMFGNQFLAYYVDPLQVGAWEETQKVNNASAMPMDGPFIFDPTPVQSEMTAVDSLVQQYSEPLAWGLVDPDDPEKGIDAFRAAIKDAGVDKVIAEIQTQLDAFVEANPDIFK